MEKISATIITFKYLPDFTMEHSYYKKYNGFMKFCGEHSIKVSDVKKVVHKLLNPQEFPSTVWEG